MGRTIVASDRAREHGASGNGEVVGGLSFNALGNVGNAGTDMIQIELAAVEAGRPYTNQRHIGIEHGLDGIRGSHQTTLRFIFVVQIDKNVINPCLDDGTRSGT